MKNNPEADETLFHWATKM